MSTSNDTLLQKIDRALNETLDKIISATFDHQGAIDVRQLADAVQSLSYAKWQLLQPVEHLLRDQGVMPGLSKSDSEKT